MIYDNNEIKGLSTIMQWLFKIRNYYKLETLTFVFYKSNKLYVFIIIFLLIVYSSRKWAKLNNPQQLICLNFIRNFISIDYTQNLVLTKNKKPEP